MKSFSGPAIFLDRNDINTDEIIPAKYLTEITKTALQPHLLEDLLLDGRQFDNQSEKFKEAKTIVTRENCGCGSSREHAVWAFEVNDINAIIAQSFARIFRQNMFNCGILAIELDKPEIDALFSMSGNINISIDIEQAMIKATSDNDDQHDFTCSFILNTFDKSIIQAGGWLAYADKKY